MNNKKLTSTWNYSEGWIKSQWEDFIKPAYELLAAKEWEKARLIMLNICNSTTFYQKKVKINSDIDKLKKDMNKTKCKEYFNHKSKGQTKEIAEMQQISVQAMYDILEKINYMFAQLGCFITVFMKDPVANSTRMS